MTRLVKVHDNCKALEFKEDVEENYLILITFKEELYISIPLGVRSKWRIPLPASPQLLNKLHHLKNQHLPVNKQVLSATTIFGIR